MRMDGGGSQTLAARDEKQGRFQISLPPTQISRLMLVHALNILIAHLIGVVLVLVHAALRNTHNLFLHQGRKTQRRERKDGGATETRRAEETTKVKMELKVKREMLGLVGTIVGWNQRLESVKEALKSGRFQFVAQGLKVALRVGDEDDREPLVYGLLRKEWSQCF